MDFQSAYCDMCVAGVEQCEFRVCRSNTDLSKGAEVKRTEVN